MLDIGITQMRITLYEKGLIKKTHRIRDFMQFIPGQKGILLNKLIHIFDAFFRQIHLELRLITRELTKIFGVHMVMQATAFVVFTAQLVNDIYTDMIHSSSIYEKTLGLFISYIWITMNTMKMIIFNCICEEVRNKVYMHIEMYKL
jgi:uncharacterized YccA/Bax inhibitor family protein